MKTALLFAGQATQYVGMGRHLFENYPTSRAIFQSADAILGEPLSQLIFDGPQNALNLTRNTQPAVLTTAVAAWALLEERGFEPTVVAGHSLGEYAALVAAGALSFQDALRICRRRGELMQSAVPEGYGAMIIVQRLEADTVAAVCASLEGYCEISVYNAPKLIAVSGEASAVEAASVRLSELRGIVRPLAVSAPFHCQLLQPAAEALESVLAPIDMKPLRFPYIPNIDAHWTADLDEQGLKSNLVRQVVGAVRWSESISSMLEAGIEQFWHLGPGRSNLTHVKKQARKAKCLSFDDADAVAQLLSGDLS